VLLVLIFEIVWHLSGKVLPGVASTRCQFMMERPVKQRAWEIAAALLK